MDNAGVAPKGFQIAGDTVIETHAQRNDQIGIQQRTVGLNRSVHPHHA